MPSAASFWGQAACGKAVTAPSWVASASKTMRDSNLPSASSDTAQVFDNLRTRKGCLKRTVGRL